MEKIVLEMTREQAQAVMDATELAARLDIGQFNELTWRYMDKFTTDGTFDIERREMVDALLTEVCQMIFGVNKYNRPNVPEKSIDHKRCWAVYATLRHAISWHEHPKGGITVNFDKPLEYGECMPNCKILDSKILNVKGERK